MTSLDSQIAIFVATLTLHTILPMQKNNTATPVRLKEIKEPLQQEAMRIDRSLNWLILSILKGHPVVADFLKKANKK